jgi:hypothetical protein
MKSGHEHLINPAMRILEGALAKALHALLATADEEN